MATTNYPLQDVALTPAAPGVPATHGAGVALPAPGVVPQLADTAAPASAVYYSTTRNALAFKDPTGTVFLITVTVPS
jgi:hypothetical protein